MDHEQLLAAALRRLADPELSRADLVEFAVCYLDSSGLDIWRPFNDVMDGLKETPMACRVISAYVWLIANTDAEPAQIREIVATGLREAGQPEDLITTAEVFEVTQ